MLSVYRNSFDNEGLAAPSNIKNILDAIKSEQYKEATEKLRTITDKDAAYQFKRTQFIGVTFSGQFSKRNSNSLVQHSGFICLDIDKLSAEDYDRLLVNIPQDMFTYALFTSPSGNGFKLIVKIDCEDGKTHKEIYFPSLSKYYTTNYGVTIDSSGCNVDRLCYIPYDPNIFINEDSYTFYSDVSEDEIIASSRNSFESDVEYTAKNLAHCITELKIRNLDITSDYMVWIKIGMSFASMGEAGRIYYHQVSCLYPNYDGPATDKKFDNLLATKSGRISIATFFFWCKDNGIELIRKPVDPQTAQDFKELYAMLHEINRVGRPFTKLDAENLGKRALIAPEKVTDIYNKIREEHADEHGINDKPEIFKIEMFIKKNFDIQKNEVTGITEFKEKEAKEYITINKNSIYRKLQHVGFKYSLDKLKSLLASDFVPVVNPFEQYFNGLPVWDGVDHITALADHVTMVDEQTQSFWRVMFKKALVRSIACTIGGYENRIIMVLVQEAQETGKTSFIRFLNPFGSNYYTESPLRDSKDVEFRFSENFIYNLEELSSLHALDINKLKAIISKSTIKERRAYAEYEEKLPRRCNFWGSTNKAEFLTDVTNSRWLCFNVKEINHDYNNYQSGSKNIDIHKVWAQAMHLYKEGFKYGLDTLEKAYREESNKEYEMSSNERELIVAHFKASEDTDGMTLAQIEESLLIITKSRLRLSRHALSRALSQLGYKNKLKKVNKIAMRVFPIKLITMLDAPQDITDDDTPF